MNIIQVTNTFFPTLGGVERIVDGFATYLAEQGHNVTTLVPAMTKPLNLHRPYHLDYFPRNTYHSTRKNPLWLAYLHLNTTPKILSTAKNLHADIVNFHSRHFFSASRRVRRIAPTALTLQTTYFLYFKHKWWRKLLLDSFDVILAPTHQHVQYVRQLSKSQVEWVPTGINTQEFSPTRKNPQWRKKLGIQPHDVMLLCVGRMVEYKGFTDMPQVVAALRKEGIPAKLVFVGDGPSRTAIEAEVDRHHVKEAVVFHGWVTSEKELQTAYASTDIFVHPARKGEAYGRVIIEGLASGAPVLSTNTGGPADIINNGKDGFLVPPNDPKELFHIALKLAQNKSLREKVAKEGRKKAETQYSLHATTTQYLSIVKSLARD